MVLDIIEVEEGDMLPPPPVIARAGFVLIGWCRDAGLTDLIFELFAIYENTTIYAKWEQVVLNQVFVSINGPGSAYAVEGATVSYVVSLNSAQAINGIELEIEIDSDFLTPKEANARGGFVAFGAGNYGTPIYWKADGNSLKGKITLLDLNFVGIIGNFDILEIVFSINEDVLGETKVKLNYITMSAGIGEPVNVSIIKGEVATTIEEYRSPYDGNGDGVVDVHDLSFALQFLLIKEGDPGWDIAKRFDFNDDKIITIDDLIIIMANYTEPYYE